MENYISENGFNYKSVGDGQPLVILHGLMGGLSNFEGLFDFFPKNNSPLFLIMFDVISWINAKGKTIAASSGISKFFIN